MKATEAVKKRRAKKLAYYYANKERMRQQNREWIKANPEKRNASRKRFENSKHRQRYRNEYYKKNRDKILAENKKWRTENKDRRSEYLRKYAQDNRPKISASNASWRNSNPSNKIASRLRTRIWHAIKKQGAVKSKKTELLLGCTFSRLLAHLQALFAPGMSWENYGEWEVDHKKPCAVFDLSKASDQHACFHFSNLQPLWRPDNRAKHCKCA
jgi:hypothetical protein